MHQGSVLSLLLFICVLEALSREFRTGCPEEMLYADDLVLTSETMEGLLLKLKTWRKAMESKGLRVNVAKTKVMISGCSVGKPQEKGKFPCSVCGKGVGSNSIFCSTCKHWVHKKYIIKSGLTPSNIESKTPSKPSQKLLIVEKLQELTIFTVQTEVCPFYITESLSLFTTYKYNWLLADFSNKQLTSSSE